MSETPFADQVERELAAIYDFWEKFRTDPVILAVVERIKRAQEWRP